MTMDRESGGRTALVLGATGLVGGQVLRALLDDPHYGLVRILVRRDTGIHHPKLEQIITDFAEIDRVGTLVAAQDVFCCLGTTQRKAGSFPRFYAIDHDLVCTLARTAQKNGCTHFLLMSSIGADPAARSDYLRTKGEVEATLGEMGFARFSIVRPSLLQGIREETRVKEIVSAAFLNALAPLLQGRLQKYRPIAGAAVARALVAIAHNKGAGERLYESDELVLLAGRPNAR